MLRPTHLLWWAARSTDNQGRNDMEGMTIGFDGEAYESFQNVVAGLADYGVDITLDGETFDAILVGPDIEAEDGATVKFIRVVDGNYERESYPAAAVESAVVEHIEVA